MPCPMLSELPPPDKTGWPWTEESPQLPDTMPEPSTGSGQAASWPRISIVTPSYNQGQFIEETIRSVLLQGYPDLEYIVIDGGSTDDSVHIIRKYEDQLKYWVSEPDQGQYDAINKGFACSTGEIMAWLNSDDKYCPWAFQVVAQIFSDLPQVEWLTSSTRIWWDVRGRPFRAGCVPGFSRDAFGRGRNIGSPWIMQEASFWRRSLWERAGARLDVNLQMAADFELWARFWQLTNLYSTTVPLGGFRWHGDQRTSHRMQLYLSEAEAVLTRVGGRKPTWVERFLRRFIFYLPLLRRRFRYPGMAVAFDPVTGQWRVETVAFD